MILSLDFMACPKYFALVLQHDNASYQSHILAGTVCIGIIFRNCFPHAKLRTETLAATSPYSSVIHLLVL